MMIRKLQIGKKEEILYIPFLFLFLFRAVSDIKNANL
jgi:hypothetical protein